MDIVIRVYHILILLILHVLTHPIHVDIQVQREHRVIQEHKAHLVQELVPERVKQVQRDHKDSQAQQDHKDRLVLLL